MLNHLQAQARAEEIGARISALTAEGAQGGRMEELEELIGEVTCKWDASKGKAWFHGLITDTHTAASFRKMLAAMKDRKEVTLYINSVGGSPMAGIAIHSMLEAADQKITTISEGQAYSSASLVFMAGDERLIAPSAIVGIHRPRLVAMMANADELLAQAEQLEEMDRGMLAIYTSKAKREARDEIKAAMWQDTMVGLRKAEGWGLATGSVSAASTKKTAASPRERIAERTPDPAVYKDEAAVATAVADQEAPAAPAGINLAALGIHAHL